ncbi:Nn.00g062870.m01.CDS01 [Neocucurbitaria sp. VM-36]
MTFVLNPRLVPTYQATQCNPFGFSTPASRPTYPYYISRPQPRQPTYSSFNHFFSQVDELLSEIDRHAQRQERLAARIQAQREAHHQRQQRKRALRAEFAVSQIEQGWEINGEFMGFEQENISIEVADEHTLKVAGNTEWQSEKARPKTQLSKTEITTKAEDVTQNESDREPASGPEAAPVGLDSDTESHKSYQATVEDDFEDLGAEISSSISRSPALSTVVEATHPKSDDTAMNEPAVTHTSVNQQTVLEAPAQLQQEQLQEQDRIHGSFERTFRFPKRIDVTNVEASFNDGGLKITVPRAQVLQTRRIVIS